MTSPRLRKYIVLVAIIFNAPAFESCTTTRVVTKHDCDTFSNNPVNIRTTWSFAWGLIQPKDIDPKCDKRFNHLNKVAVKTNFGFALITVLTLGIAMPQQVEWCCAPYTPPPGTLGQ